MSNRRGSAAAGLTGLAIVGAFVAFLGLGLPHWQAGRDTADAAIADRSASDASIAASTLEQVLADDAACREESARENLRACPGVVYVWSPRMPLSRDGIDEIETATRSLDLSLHVIESTELTDRATHEPPTPADRLARSIVAAGATLHAPALVVHRGGELVGTAILGYKSADAYRSLVAERLAASTAPSAPTSQLETREIASEPSSAAVSFTDLPAVGQPGAYFRFVTGRNAVAYESGGAIFLLDLTSGESRVAPGYVDFVPTPDGRFFVTPGRSRELEFYDAEEVFAAARAGTGRQVPPFYVDRQMQDQYPSVGVLSTAQEAGGSRTVYRVLTSWFDRVAFRDYEVRVASSGVRSTTVRPIGEPVEACAGYRFSIPILSPTGLEVAGRDEATATTKVLRIGANGECTEAANIGLPTGKVAWAPDGRRLAFAIPQGSVSDGSGTLWTAPSDPARAGIFLYERQPKTVNKVEASEQARRLTFPEFAGRDKVVFLLPGERPGAPNRFRVVCCLP